MKILLLCEDKKIAKDIPNWLMHRFSAAEILTYDNSFAFVSGLYDDLKGEADLMLIHLKDDRDEHVVLARDMQNYFPQLKCIFFSEKDILAETVYQAEPMYFFRFPMMDEDEVYQAFRRVEREIANEQAHSLRILKNRKVIRIRFEAVNYIESVGRKIFLYSDEGYYDTNMSMQEALASLPDYFLQCHRSYIVNTRKISDFDSVSVRIKSKDRIPVSKRYRSVIKNLM